MCVLLFVYGTLKRNCPAHYLLSNAKYLGKAILPGYTLLIDGVPYAVQSNGNCQVRGELYDVPEKQFRKLDRYEGMFYQRRAVKVIADGKELEAQAYIATFGPVPVCFNSRFYC